MVIKRRQTSNYYPVPWSNTADSQMQQESNRSLSMSAAAQLCYILIPREWAIGLIKEVSYSSRCLKFNFFGLSTIEGMSYEQERASLRPVNRLEQPAETSKEAAEESPSMQELMPECCLFSPKTLRNACMQSCYWPLFGQRTHLCVVLDLWFCSTCPKGGNTTILKCKSDHLTAFAHRQHLHKQHNCITSGVFNFQSLQKQNVCKNSL